MTANCDRCRRLLQVAPSRNEGSAPFRLAKTPEGLCPECAMTEFLYNTYPINLQLDESGPELLLKPLIPQVFKQSGLLDDCDMSVEEIDWKRLVANWTLPVETRRGPTNPYSMGESERSKHLAFEVATR